MTKQKKKYKKVVVYDDEKIDEIIDIHLTIFGWVALTMMLAFGYNVLVLDDISILWMYVPWFFSIFLDWKIVRENNKEEYWEEV